MLIYGVRYAIFNYIEGKTLSYILLKYGVSEKTIFIIALLL